MTLIARLPEACSAVAVDGDRLYAGLESRLSILDITQPGDPVEKDAVATEHRIMAIAVSGATACVLDQAPQLRVMDVTDDTDPVEVVHRALSATVSSALVAAEGYLYVGEAAQSYIASGLRILDVHAPADWPRGST